MSTDRWQRLQEIFHQALEKKVGERATFVAIACGSDLELRDEILALLGAESTPATMLDTPLNQLVPIDDEQLEGQSLGAYRLIRQIGTALPRPSVVIIGEPTSMKVVSAHKGVWTFQTTVTGHEVHSSQPHRGVSAVMTGAAAKIGLS